MTEYEPVLLRYATRIVGNIQFAEDVVQNTFIKLYRNWKNDTRPTEALKAWLYRVTHNEAVDLIRRETRLRDLHAKHAEQQAESCDDGVNCPETPEQKTAAVMAHVQRLPEAERQVLLLRLEEGLSYKEISAVTGRTEGNVGCILHNAVKKISESLKANRQDNVAGEA